MPIVPKYLDASGVLQTILLGRVTDDELLAYYSTSIFDRMAGRWRELVDGREITQMAITPDGQKRLAGFAAAHADALRGGRVAMVAASDVTFGMFRMWEMQREGLGYEVRVFHDYDEALAWVSAS